MKIGIICAAQTELDPFIAHIQGRQKSKKALLAIYEGLLEGFETAALFCGVCKVNAALATQVLIDHYGVNLIINSGTAGGIDPRLKVFDTVVATAAFYHDVKQEILRDYHPWMKTIDFLADERLVALARDTFKGQGNIYFGKMTTGEQFIEGQKRKELMESYSPLSADMETAAIAHVCYANHVPFIAIRAITDIGAGDCLEESQFEANVNKASQRAKDVTLSLVKALRKEKNAALYNEKKEKTNEGKLYPN